jgi:hypothetical protein
MHLIIPLQSFFYKYYGAMHLYNLLCTIICYKYYGALDLYNPFHTLICYKYYGALHLSNLLCTIICYYFESCETIKEAIKREKRIKAGNRKKKIELINETNPEWDDLNLILDGSLGLPRPPYPPSPRLRRV